MATEKDYIQTTCYLQVVPTYSAYRKDANGEREVESIAVKSVTQRKPSKALNAGGVVVKMRLRLPRAAFKPLAPSVVIDIPLDMLVQPDEVEAVVEDD